MVIKIEYLFQERKYNQKVLQKQLISSRSLKPRKLKWKRIRKMSQRTVREEKNFTRFKADQKSKKRDQDLNSNNGDEESEEGLPR